MDPLKIVFPIEKMVILQEISIAQLSPLVQVGCENMTLVSHCGRPIFSGLRGGKKPEKKGELGGRLRFEIPGPSRCLKWVIFGTNFTHLEDPGIFSFHPYLRN